MPPNVLKRPQSAGNPKAFRTGANYQGLIEGFGEAATENSMDFDAVFDDGALWEHGNFGQGISSLSIQNGICFGRVFLNQRLLNGTVSSPTGSWGTTISSSTISTFCRSSNPGTQRHPLTLERIHK